MNLLKWILKKLGNNRHQHFVFVDNFIYDSITSDYVYVIEFDAHSGKYLLSNGDECNAFGYSTWSEGYRYKNDGRRLVKDHDLITFDDGVNITTNYFIRCHDYIKANASKIRYFKIRKTLMR